MSTAPTTTIDPWTLEIVAVVRGSHSDAERRALARDVERGTRYRLFRGASVERAAFRALSPEGQHLVRMRAWAALALGPVVVSHVSAAVLHGLPVLRSRLDVLHTTVEMEDDRHREGVSVHLFLLDDGEVVRYRDLLVSSIGRTVVDLAGATTRRRRAWPARAARPGPVAPGAPSDSPVRRSTPTCHQEPQ